MVKTAAVVAGLAVLALIGLLDRDGRLVGGDLAARAMGYTLRVELRIERSDLPPARRAAPVLGDRCGLALDTLVLRAGAP